MQTTYTKRHGHERYRTRKRNNNPAAVLRRKGALGRALELVKNNGYTLVNGVFSMLAPKRKPVLLAEIETLKTHV